jgi:two-component system response regulator AlgR
MKVLIVDDEAPARDRLNQLLEDSPQHTVVGVAANGQQAIDVAAETRPDVVLLDIRMPGLDGIEVARHLNSLENPPAVIFATAYDEYAIEAFEANAVGYVLKPVRRERLEKAMLQAARLNSSLIGELAETPGINSQRNHICARVQDQLILIDLTSISRFQADQKYVRVHHAGGEHLIDEALKALEDEFSDQFVRIHRSALISIAHIDAVQKTSDGQMVVALRDAPADADGLIISRRHLADVKRRLRGV